MTAPSSGEAIQLIKSLLGELKTSHTALYTPDDLEYSILLDVVPPRSDPDQLMDRKFWGSRSHYAGIGAFTREIDGRHFIDGIMEGSPADRAGLKYGDEIINVDGRPYAQIAAFRGKVGQRSSCRSVAPRGPSLWPMRVDVLNLIRFRLISQLPHEQARGRSNAMASASATFTCGPSARTSPPRAGWIG